MPEFSARLYREVELLKEAIGGYHARKSVEIGCGYGRLTPWIAEHSDEHYAVEPESALLNATRKLYPQIHFYNSKAQKLPFSDEYFDLCVSWTVLQHIPPREMSKAVTEIKRVCTSRAIIVLTEAVGKQEGAGTWEHSLEESKGVLLPWELTWSTDRKIEETYRGKAGLIMRFERVE